MLCVLFYKIYEIETYEGRLSLKYILKHQTSQHFNICNFLKKNFNILTLKHYNAAFSGKVIIEEE